MDTLTNTQALLSPTCVDGPVEFFDTLIEGITLDEQSLHSAKFEGCTFNKCSFINTAFPDCQFIDCIFVECDMSNFKPKGALFGNVEFKESKVIGVDWTQANWPHIKPPPLLSFDQSNISHSSFFGFTLKELRLIKCKAHDVDFREATLIKACFEETDFYQALFQKTDLTHASFIDAINYALDPNANKVRHATFSLPDVVGLLQNHGIKIDGL